MKRKLFLCLAALLFLTLVTLKANTPLQAASHITVTTNLDEFDRSGTGQGCSLREAIQAAENNAPFGGCPGGNGDDTILLQATTYVSTREYNPYGDSGAFSIASNVTLQGALTGTTIIDGGGSAISDPVLAVSIGYTVKLNKLVIQNGWSDYDGGGINISAEAQVTINNSTIRNNRTTGTGGGIYNQGFLKLKHTTVRNNYAPGPGGGIANTTKYDKYAPATAWLEESIVQDNNSGSQGGGIFNADATLTLIQSTVDKNSAGAHGGGIWNDSVAVLRNSTISNNSAHAGGGGIENSELLTAVNVTISGNRARFLAGGVYNSGAAEFYNSTIASNIADSDWSNDENHSGGGIYSSNQTAVVRNTIIADNRNLDSLLGDHKDDCAGDLQLEYYSLLESANDCELHFSQTNNILYQDPKLEPLADNGGATKTHALKANSPAIDAGHPNGCKDSNGSTLMGDQRGYLRTINADTVGNPQCDIGAYEYKSIPLNIGTVTPPTQTPSPTATHTPAPSQCSAKPGVPTLHLPSKAAVVTSLDVKLDWSKETCATQYKVRVRMDSKNGAVVVKKSISNDKYKIQTIAKGHTYFWRVMACNTHGCGKTKIRKFSVE